MIPKWRVCLVIICFGLTWYAMQVTGTVSAVPINKSLLLFPKTIGHWQQVNSFRSSEEIEKKLGVADYIQYSYVTPDKAQINFYVGYYEAVGNGAAYHSPKNCLPGGGWGIDTIKEVSLQTGTEGRQDSIVTEMLIRNGSQYQVVLYWFQNRGRVIASEYWEKVYLVLDALFQGRRDGAFVRIIANVGDGNLEETEQMTKEFAEQVMAQLESYLPGKRL